jgi:hypothetical protein
MTRVFVGLCCACMSVALLLYAVRLAAGEALGMTSMGLGLGLLLVAGLTLRRGPTRL